MITMVNTKLKALREELRPKIAQEDMAQLGGLRANTYRNAERGHNVSYTTAKAVLEALNSARASRGLPPVTIDDLGLNIV